MRDRTDDHRALQGHWLLDVTVPLASSPPCPLEKLSPCFGLNLCMTSGLCRPAPGDSPDHGPLGGRWRDASQTPRRVLAPSHGLGVMPLSSAVCRAEGGRGLPAAPQTAWRSTAPRWQEPSAAVCSLGMPGAFQTPEGTARPSPPAPAAHAEHAGGWPGSPSGPCSKPYDRQTDKQTDLLRERACTARAPAHQRRAPPQTARLPAACPLRSRPVSPLPWLHEVQRESGGSHRSRHTRMVS